MLKQDSDNHRPAQGIHDHAFQNRLVLPQSYGLTKVSFQRLFETIPCVQKRQHFIALHYKNVPGSVLVQFEVYSNISREHDETFPNRKLSIL